jgi:hypothetical protein
MKSVTLFLQSFQDYFRVISLVNIIPVQYLRFAQRRLWRMRSSGTWRRVDLVWTDVSEENDASIFRVENPRARNSVSRWLQTAAKFSTLKMEAIRSSETSVHTRFTLRHIPENGILHHPCSLDLFRIWYDQWKIILVSGFSSWSYAVSNAECFPMFWQTLQFPSSDLTPKAEAI